MDKRYCPYCMAYIGQEEVCPACGRRPAGYEPSPFHLPPGTLLRGKYLVGSVLGEGGFGITYVGRDLTLDMKVAIKEFYPRDMVSRSAASSTWVYVLKSGAGEGYEKGKDRFLHEARVLARLEKQPAIVRVRDFFEDNNTAYIVMEFVEGITLKDLVAQRGGRLPPGELLELVEPLFNALTVVHDAGLIHRDISPDNIMLEGSQVRLLDFGCARDTNGDGTQAIFRKEGYTPPEQYQSKGQGPWTDVYAFCATLYYCLTGKTPPSAYDRKEKDKLHPPTKMGVPLSEKQEQALLKGLSYAASDRYKSMEELHEDLYVSTPAPPKKWWRIVIAAALGAAAVIGALFAAGVLPPEPAVTPTPEPAVAAGPAATVEPTPSPAPALGSGEALDTAIFAEGRSLAAGIYSRADMDAMQTDPYVTAVVLEQGAVLDLNDPAAGEYILKKPLWVKNGATLRANWLTVPGGVSVEMDGTLDCRGLITLEGSATRLYMAGDVTGETLELAAVVMDSGANIGFMNDDLADSMQDMLLPAPKKTADMVSVRTAEELQRALDDGQSVAIDADMTVADVFVPSGATVWIGEGVTVDSAAETGFSLYGGDGPVTFVNEGTYVGTLNASDGAPGARVFNYGTMKTGGQDTANSALYFRSGTLLNYGTYIGGGLVSRIWEQGRMINLGSAELYHFEVLGSLVNLGSLAARQAGEVDPQSGGPLFSGPTISSCGAFYNAGTLTADGQSGVSGDGILYNDGVFEDRSTGPLAYKIYNRGRAVLSGTHFGVVAGPGSVEVPEGQPCNTAVARTASLVQPPADVAVVRDEAALRQAAAAGQSICVEGSVTLAEPLEIAAPLYVTGMLRGQDLTVTNGSLAVLSGGSVTLETLRLLPVDDQEGIVDLSLAAGSALKVTGTLELRHAAFVAEGGTLDLTGAAVDVNNASFMPVRLDAFRLDETDVSVSECEAATPPRGGNLTAEGLRLRLNGGCFRVCADCELTGADITVSKAGEEEPGSLVFAADTVLRDCTVNVTGGELQADLCDLSLEGSTRLVNQGNVIFNGEGEHSIRSAATVRITNYGRMELSMANIDLRQPIDNLGKLVVWHDESDPNYKPFDMYMGNPPMTLEEEEAERAAEQQQ